jgi:hypothetical protein
MIVYPLNHSTYVHNDYDDSNNNNNTDMRRLTTGIRSEKCVLKRSRRCTKVMQGTYTNIDSTASYEYTPRLYGTAYCS